MDSDDKNPDAALHVRFQMITVYQFYDSTQAFLPGPKGEPGLGAKNPNYTGHPIYKDVPHIEITTPGGFNRIVEPVRPEHKARFPKHWAMFQMAQGDGDQIVGTKLSEWPAITRARAEELRAMKYYVVEQLANASDAQVQGLGMDGTMLRMKAKTFLEVANKTADAERKNAELAEKQKQLDDQAAQIKALQDQMAAFMAQPKAEAPKRKGRPPKVHQPETVEAT